MDEEKVVVLSLLLAIPFESMTARCKRDFLFRDTVEVQATIVSLPFAPEW